MFEFMLAAPVRCPLCLGPVSEKTLVDISGGIEVSAGFYPVVPLLAALRLVPFQA